MATPPEHRLVDRSGTDLSFLPVVVLICVVVVEAAMAYAFAVRSVNWIPCALIALGTAVLSVVYRKNPTRVWTIITTSLLLETVVGLSAS